MNNYVPNNLLKKEVANKDENAVRGALFAIILSEPSFQNKEVYQAIKYAEDNGVDVYQEHNPSIEIIEDSTKWNSEYFGKVANQLTRNFSKERLSHLEKVGKKVYAAPNDSTFENTTATQKATAQPKYTQQQYRSQRTQAEPERNFITGRQALALAAVGIAVAAIIILIARN